MPAIKQTNHPGEFRRTLPSGAEIWGPARLTRGQNTLLSSLSRPMTEMPDGNYRRAFDLELLIEELLIRFAEDPDSGWSIRLANGSTLEMTREAITGIDIHEEPEANIDLALAGIELTAFHYPQYAFLLPPKPGAEGEETGSPESEPTPRKGAKATSGSSPKGSHSTTETTTATT